MIITRIVKIMEIYYGKYIAIACGGALGALARTVVGEWVMARLGPYPLALLRLI